MHSHIRSGRRVSIFGLVLFAATMVVPGLTVSDSAAEARVEALEPVVLEAAPAMVAATPSNTVSSSFDAASWDGAALGDIDPAVFATALSSAEAAIARGDVAAPATLSVIDFSKPSTVKRLWVYDLRSRTLLFEEHVSHGRGSGKTLATAFSNLPSSNQSSLGLFRAGETYIGKHGYSMRLDGLEAGVNDRARERAIVMHGADYVNPAAARANGYLGRSLGCPALRPAVTRDVIDAVKNGGLLFAYYPDQHWLKTSAYLN